MPECWACLELHKHVLHKLTLRETAQRTLNQLAGVSRCARVDCVAFVVSHLAMTAMRYDQHPLPRATQLPQMSHTPVIPFGALDSQGGLREPEAPLWLQAAMSFKLWES